MSEESDFKEYSFEELLDYVFVPFLFNRDEMEVYLAENEVDKLTVEHLESLKLSGLDRISIRQDFSSKESSLKEAIFDERTLLDSIYMKDELSNEDFRRLIISQDQKAISFLFSYLFEKYCITYFRNIYLTHEMFYLEGEIYDDSIMEAFQDAFNSLRNRIMTDWKESSLYFPNFYSIWFNQVFREKTINFLRRKPTSGTEFMLQSGGNTGPEEPRYEKVQERLLENIRSFIDQLAPTM